MKSRATALFVFLIACIFLIFSLYSLLKDLIFFLTRQDAVAKVERIIVTDAHDPNVVIVKYRNEYLGKEVIGRVGVRKHFDIKNGSTTEVCYSKWFQNNLYIREYKEPSLMIVFFDLFLCLLMLVAISATKKSVFFRDKSSYP